MKIWISNKNSENWHFLYKKAEPYAETLKIFLQMAVGVAIIYFLFWKLALTFQLIEPESYISTLIVKNKLLEIVAYGLGLSAGIELAYMLFTPGPDETIDPLLMGLASTLLLLASNETNLTWQAGLGVMFITISMAVLFYFRNKLSDINSEAIQTNKKIVG